MFHARVMFLARGITSGEYRYMLFAGIHPLCRVCDIPLVDISHKTGIGFVNRNDIAIILVARLPHKHRRTRLEGRTPGGVPEHAPRGLRLHPTYRRPTSGVRFSSVKNTLVLCFVSCYV